MCALLLFVWLLLLLQEVEEQQQQSQIGEHTGGDRETEMGSELFLFSAVVVFVFYLNNLQESNIPAALKWTKVGTRTKKRKQQQQ